MVMGASTTKDTPTGYETWLQRRRPISGDNGPLAQGATSPGGGPRRMLPLTIAPGMVDTRLRDPMITQDQLIRRDRHAYYAAPRFIPQGNMWVDWTRAGPHRPELGMRNQTYQRQQGTSHSRFDQVDSATGGRHTDVASATRRTLPRYVNTPQMMPGRQNRLAAAVYAGQSYSQTTIPQGGGR